MVFSNAENMDYNLYLKDFGWTDIDQFASEKREKTPVII